MTTGQLYQLVQVVRVRKKGYAFVHMINRDGTIKKRQRALVVHFPHEEGELRIGSLWEVCGPQEVNQFMSGGYLVYEDVLYANKARFVRPSRHTLARWISLNVDGIGEVLGNRLTRNRSLEQWIKNKDVEGLCSVPGITQKLAHNLIQTWPQDGLYKTIEWLDALDLSPSLGYKLIKILGADAVSKLKANPFMLLGMNVPYTTVLEVIERLALDLSNELLTAGAAMHVAIQDSASTCSTVITAKRLKAKVEKLTGTPCSLDPGQAAVKHGLLVAVKGGYQIWGAALMEAKIAQQLMTAMNRPAGDGAMFAPWERNISDSLLDSTLAAYEKTLKFPLTGEQRDAVKGTLKSSVVGISGGAGTGKTTILKAVIELFEHVAEGLACFPVALAGRAAQRMAEATGMPAQTIAKFICDHQGRTSKIPDHVLVIIDEASMVDLLSMYRLVSLLPPATRFIFIGDTAQLPPVASGLVFHALVNSTIPFYELSQVKRQSELSAIHRFATAVREGRFLMPEAAEKTLAESSDCCLLSPPSRTRLTELWKEARGRADCIILSPRNAGEWGVISLNQHFQAVSGLDRSDLQYLDPQKGWIPWITRHNHRLKEGDPVMVTENLYDEDLDVRNGDLGVIVAVNAKYSKESFGIAEINGKRLDITQELLEVLDLAYAITIHKSQGSQWRTVFAVIPREARNMLDASLVYTAATRPSETLVLVADTLTMQDAILSGNSVSRRLVDLDTKLVAYTEVLGASQKPEDGNRGLALAK